MKFRPSSRQTIQGAAFPDFVRTESFGQYRHREGDGQTRRTMREFLLPFSLFFLVGMLFARLVSIEIFQGKYYAALAENNRVKTTVVHAPRGIIFDRNKTPLVFNIPGFRQKQNDKIVILSHEEAAKKLSSGEKGIEVDSLRQYPYKEVFSHVLGYIGQITEDELQFSQYTSYRAGDVIGKGGIEQMYEVMLTGKDGKQLVEVDAVGKTVRALGQEDPIAGGDITLTIDAKLQEAAFMAMKDIKKGAVIVSTPKGEILVMLSKPSFDPNLFTLGETYKVATDSAYVDIVHVLTDGSNQPLLNRAIAGVYPPGSTFKLVTAASGLEEKKIDERFTVMDTGVLRVGAFSFGNWYFLQYGRTEGEVDVVKGIKRSNDIFFYKVAEHLGVELLSKMARKLGAGEKTGIDLLGEAKGLVPTDAWKREAIGEQWYLGDTYHYGIGQGYLLTTPLQVNVWTQAILNRGEIYRPHLLKNSEFRIRSSEFLSEKNFSLIRQGMIESCSPTGVAWPLFDFKVKNAKLKIDRQNFFELPQSTTSANLKDYRHVSVACKTGTAQHGGEQTLPHAWITLWAPAYDPEIVVTVLAESSGEGSSIAGPVAKKVLEEWFSR